MIVSLGHGVVLYDPTRARYHAANDNGKRSWVPLFYIAGIIIAACFLRGR